MNNLKVIAAFLAGAVAGSALGILFAPAKGSDTRKKAISDAKDMATNLNGRIRDGISDAKSQLEKSSKNPAAS